MTNELKTSMTIQTVKPIDRLQGLRPNDINRHFLDAIRLELNYTRSS